MVALLLLALLAGLIGVREGARLAIHGRPARWRGAVELATPVAMRRRVLAIAGGLVATYLAVSAIAYAHLSIYGWPSGDAVYAVGEVLEGGAAEGLLQRGDRIAAVDDVSLSLRQRPSLVDRVQAKGGAPVTLDIVRDGAPLRVTVAPRRGTAPNGRDLWLIGIRPVPIDIRASLYELESALRYPIDRTRHVGRDIRSMFRSEAGGPVRIGGEFRRAFEREQRPVADRALELALQTAGSLFLLLVLLDLVRLAIVIRDTLRAR